MIDVQGCRVLIADDEESLRFVLRELLTREGFEVLEADNGEQAVAMARREGFDLYLLDMKMPKLDGLTALREIRQLYPEALAIMITAFGSQQLAIDALKAGAYDYFTKPFNVDELRVILTRALGKQALLRKIAQLERQLVERRVRPRGNHGMIGRGPAMRNVGTMIERVAALDVTVLITGESGTGKELVAHAVHVSSPRKNGPFVKVNCAAIPEPLLESELFGHERGAFTGATHTKIGKFEVASGGTILLDEIGEMPLSLQSKLLRVLAERTIERVGGNQPRPVDIRILTSTNRDLAAMVEEKTFREDLYFRINVVPIHLPPLRERREDLPELIQHFIAEFNGRFGKRIRGVTPQAMALLDRHDWPGNVRELENAIQRAMVMAGGDEIAPPALPAAIRGDEPAGGAPGANGTNGAAGGANGANRRRSADDGSLNEAVTVFDFNTPMIRRIESLVEAEEKRIIQQALAQTDGHRERTAELLGISRKSLHNKMQKYRLFD
jgi:DNA-binding NtrC family response regulator